MSHTLATAAAACGVNKSTVLRAIKSGRLSGAKDVHGEWRIDPAELHRVYPPVEARNAAGTGARNDTQYLATAAIAEAHQRASLAEQRLSELKAMLSDMQADRDAWREQAQRLLLTDRRPWWWRRLDSLRSGVIAGN
jgi:hypothetical protein